MSDLAGHAPDRTGSGAIRLTRPERSAGTSAPAVSPLSSRNLPTRSGTAYAAVPAVADHPRSTGLTTAAAMSWNGPSTRSSNGVVWPPATTRHHLSIRRAHPRSDHLDHHIDRHALVEVRIGGGPRPAPACQDRRLVGAGAFLYAVESSSTRPEKCCGERTFRISPS